jgi:peptidoglycan/xylan/chitin deacetylase (PgdA/CDA1 family)
VIIHLCFHGIGTCAREREPGEARYWVAKDLFRRVLDEVPGRDHVRLSFDDGNRSDLEVAAPELVERGLQAEFFALAGRLDDPASLDGDALVQLRRLGMGIGSHGWNHVPWRGLSPTEERLELVAARDALVAASGGPVDKVALPLGRYDRRLLHSLRRQGYRAVYSSDRRPARSGAWLQARYSVTASDTVESVKRIINHAFGPRDLVGGVATAVKRLR